MRKNARVRFLPIVIVPALMPALLLPMLTRFHLPDSALGGSMGFFVGLALAGFIWIIKGKTGCSTDG